MLKVDKIWQSKVDGATWFKLINTSKPFSPLYYKLVGKTRLEEYYITRNNGYVASSQKWIKVKHKGLSYNIIDIWRAYEKKRYNVIQKAHYNQLEFFDMKLSDLVNTAVNY